MNLYLNIIILTCPVVKKINDLSFFFFLTTLQKTGSGDLVLTCSHLRSELGGRGCSLVGGEYDGSARPLGEGDPAQLLHLQLALLQVSDLLQLFPRIHRLRHLRQLVSLKPKSRQ